MKIWIAITNLRGGGAERAIVNIAGGLARRGHAVSLLLLEDRIEYPVPPGVAVQRISYSARPISTGWLGKRVAAWRLRNWARREYRAGRPDLVISTLPFADEVVRLAGLQGVWHRIANTLSAEIAMIRSIDPQKANRRIERYRRLYANGNIIAVSRGVLTDLENTLGIRAARSAVIHNPFDLKEIARCAAVPQPDLPNEPFILYAGRLVPQKRHDLLLDAYAASKVPHRLVLLTKPSTRLRQMIAARGLKSRVMIAGFRENPFPWYAKAAALVLCSDFEGFPNVLVEALACGTPVISTDCPSGPNEILTGDLSRFLSPCGDVEALAKNLASVVESPPRIDPAIVTRFSDDAALDAIEALAVGPERSNIRGMAG